MTRFPIPDDALDDRLAILGTAGSGKTYLALTAIERLLTRGARVIMVDPLGVGWGLRLDVDGKKASPFNVPIFGGSHGDIGLTEHAGAIVGETVAKMRESCIIDLSGLGTKASERRFMLAFLTALYRNATKDPVHLIVDESDMFAPQRLMDREGDAAKLLGMMETIVRRGRVSGFIPWLITQRPAVLSKDVLSQADGLVALKLTSSQDRDAIGAWIEGQADKADAKAILASLPGMERGQGVVWIPGRGILETATFPAKKTFDSSRTPKRGEKRQATELQPLDLGALKDRLSKVETEAKANDPRALKTEITRLKTELAKNQRAPSNEAAKITVVDQKAQERALAEAFMRGKVEGREEGYLVGHHVASDLYPIAIKYFLDHVPDLLSQLRNGLHGSAGEGGSLCQAQEFTQERAGFVGIGGEKILAKLKRQQRAPVSFPFDEGPAATKSETRPPLSHAPRITPSVKVVNGTDASGLPAPQRKVLASIGFWMSVGTEQPTRAQVGGVAGYSPSSGGFNNLLGALNSAGLITIPAAGRVQLSDGAPFDPLTMDEARDKVMSVLSGPQRKLVKAALEAGDAITRDQLGEATGYSPSSGGFNNLIGSLCTLTVFEKPSAGMVGLSDWAREILA